jgi:hypothetical protein
VVPPRLLALPVLLSPVVLSPLPLNVDSDGPPYPASPRVQLFVITQHLAGRSIYQVESSASQTGDGLVDFTFGHGRIVGKPALDA